MNNWYQLSKEESLTRLKASAGGLSGEQAAERMKEFGENRLHDNGRKKTWQVFLEQFKDLLVIILLVSAVISAVSGSGESTIVIVAALVMNAVLGTVQHQKAEKSLDSLKVLSAPEARVMRDGIQQKLPSSQVLPGDILILETGDYIAADGRILEQHSLQVDESSLTGESEHVKKQAGAIRGDNVALAEQSNMVFASSMVTGGRAVVLVTATGMYTELGKIASLMNATEEKKTPLQISMDQFSGRLATTIIIICLGVFLLDIYRNIPLLEAMMFAVALAVAAIPEALSSIVTIVQAMGTQKMAREHAIIKDLKAVESLGCVSVICSDKTGTLTQNRMSVQQVYLGGKIRFPHQIDEENPLCRRFLQTALLANDAVRDGALITGDPTEAALLELVSEPSRLEEIFYRVSKRMGELPFDSQRKLMSAVYVIDDKKVILTKGAMDVLICRCTSIWERSGIRQIQEGDKRRLMEQNMTWSGEGLRVLAFAFREMDRGERPGLKSEDGLVFLGMAAMMDPPRPESRPAVVSARKAGIRTVMITGDHKVTASAIANKIGILDEGGLAVTGAEIDAMGDAELMSRLEQISVYARVSPEHKIRIVSAWQAKGQIVAMTGDGVNDAPALKKADIGVAMGITGTEVSKDAASMILTDDNFATIIKAVANGRNVYRNIKNAIQFLLSGNIAGIFCVLYTSLLAMPMPFAPVHLLFINLVTDSLPALAIGMEQAEEGLLEEPPRNPQKGILTMAYLRDIVLQGGLIAIATMLAYHTGMRTGGQADASTMAFTTLTLARLFHGFNCRSEHSVMWLGICSNPYTVAAFGAGVLLLMAVLFVPGLQGLFAAADLGIRQLSTIFIFALLPTMVIQAWKTIEESLD